MATLIYGDCSRKKYGAALNIVVYQPDRRHYFNSMRLIDSIMMMNRQKRGMLEHNPRSGKYRMTPANSVCSPITFRVRRMM